MSYGAYNIQTIRIYMDTMIVNFFGGPGAAKSTMAADVFAQLKWKGINCELVTEYAKSKVWEGSKLSEQGWQVDAPTLDNQLYVFGKQHNSIFRLIGKVEVIITDSPIILSTIYDKHNDEILRQLVLNEFSKFDNLNFFINRFKDYNPMGRMQTLDEAIRIDDKIKNFLTSNSIDFEYVNGTPEGAKIAAMMVLECFNDDKLIESL